MDHPEDEEDKEAKIGLAKFEFELKKYKENVK
jgi:hypothetical protein